MCEGKKRLLCLKRNTHRHQHTLSEWVLVATSTEWEKVFVWDLWGLTSSFKLPKNNICFLLSFLTLFIWAFSVSSFSFISSLFNCLSHAFSVEGKRTTMNRWGLILGWGQLHHYHLHSCIVFNVRQKQPFHPKSSMPKFKQGKKKINNDSNLGHSFINYFNN